MSPTHLPLNESERDELNALRERVAVLERLHAQYDREFPYYRQFAQAIRQSASSVVITDADGAILFVNPRFTEMTGYSAQEVLGQNPRMLQSKLTPRETYRDLWDTLLAGQTWRGEFTNRRKDGSLYYEVAAISPVFDDKGQVTHFVAVKQDITARREAEEALRVNQQNAREFQDRLKALHRANIVLSGIRDMVDLCRQTIVLGRAELGFDRMGMLLISDDGTEFYGMFGTDAQGQLRDERGHRAVIAQDSRVRVAQRERGTATAWEHVVLNDWGKALGEGWAIIAPLWDDDRSFGWLATDNLLSGAPMKPYATELLTLYGATVAHLMNRLRTEEALNEGNVFTQAILRANPDLIVRMRADGTYLDVRPGLSTTSLFDPPQILGKNVREILPEPAAEMLLERVREAVTTNEFQSLEYPIVQGETTRYFESRIQPLSSDEVLCVIRDITDQKQALERSVDLAIQQERMRLLTNFVTSASHEFRTPLSIIGVNLYLAEKTTDPDRRFEALRAIREQTQTLTQLVEGLITVMRLDWVDSLADHPVNLVHMLNDLVHKAAIRAKSAQLTVESNLVADLPPVMGNISRLAQALNHLMDNALRFTPPGGQIAVSSAHEGDSIVIALNDTGIGIDPNHLQHIFERFYRADSSQTMRGLGLGLPIAQRIVELHGGRIEVESQPNQGSTFRVILPVLSGAQPFEK